MAPTPTSPGVVGLDGRVPAIDPTPVLSASLTLDGRSVPLVGSARLYTCGITPYDVTHLGHAATFVWADLLTAVVHALGVRPLTCRNVTDVDDVLTAAAGRRGAPYDEFALMQEFLFDRDMAALAVARPDQAPHARGHVGAVLQLATALLRTGAAYERDGYVFFRGARAVTDSGLATDQARGLAREYGDLPGEEAADGREEWYDVPVWRPSPPEHPAWPSPWGWGRPGWHAECAAMAWSVHGTALDVLVGGADLTFPHHAYQAAMVEAATGVAPFARALMHVGTVHLDGAKMAKSTGNLVLVGELLQRAPGPAVRLMLLDRPWRQSWEYTHAALDEAAARLESLYSAAARPGPESARAEVLGALAADLDVPRAVGLALEAGGPGARYLLDVLRLSGG